MAGCAKKVSIAILGAGALGLLWLSKLTKMGISCGLLINHSCTKYSLISSYVRLIEQGKTVDFPIQAIADPRQCSALLITVKAFQVMPALYSWINTIPYQLPIILMHNGMGVLEQCCWRFPRHLFLRAVISHGAIKQHNYQVQYNGSGQTLVGNELLNARPFIRLIATLNKALPPVIWTANMQKHLWHKLAVNAVINPLTTINNCKNGELLNKKYQQIIHLLCQELLQVMTLEQIETSLNKLIMQVRQVAKQTANNFSSMRQDHYHQKPSEIDYINGYLLTRANYHNIKIPHNRQLIVDIKHREQCFISAKTDTKIHKKHN